MGAPLSEYLTVDIMSLPEYVNSECESCGVRLCRDKGCPCVDPAEVYIVTDRLDAGPFCPDCAEGRG